MGKVIKNKLQGMSLKAKVGLVLILTLVASVFMYEGWYKPGQLQAATVSYFMATDTSTNLGADGTCNVNGISPYTSTGIGRTLAATTEGTLSVRYYPTITSANTPTVALEVYGPVYSGAVNISAISASAGLRGLASNDTVKLDLYDYDPAGAANNGTLVASSTAKTLTSGTSTAQYTWTAANFTINGTGRVAAGHRLQFRFTWTSTLTGTPRVMYGFAGTTTSTNFTVTETSAVANPTVTGASPALKQGASGTVTVTGTGFQSGATVALSGTGVSAGAASYVNATTLTVPVTVAADAATGTRNVTVTNPDTGTATGTGLFTVNAAPAPTVTAASPDGMLPGSGPTTVTVTGTNFLSGATVAISGSPLTLGTVSFVDATTLTVPVTVPAGATIGQRDVTVTLPGGQSATGTGVFSVLSPCGAGTPTALAHGPETTGAVPLSWTGGANTNYFNVYRDGVKISSDGAVTTGSFTDTTAAPGGSYVYTVTGYNAAGACESAPSASTTGETLANTPVAPTVNNVGDGPSLTVRVNDDGNQPGASYAIRINGGGVTNQFVQSGGSVGPAAVWLTRADWGTKTVSGLTPGSNYSIDAKARNTALVETGYGPAATGNPHVSLAANISSCAGCHGNPPVDNASRIGGTSGQFPGSHSKHSGYVCSKCHVNNTSYAHANGTIEMANPINGTSGSSYSRGTSFPVSASFTPGNCSNISCHGNGTSIATGTVAPNSTPNWGSPGTGCTMCHQTPPAYTSGTPKANSHGGVSHSAATCDVCHNSVTYSGGVYSTVPALHNDGSYSINTSFGYVFSSTGGTCATPGNGCHGPTPGIWGGTLGCIDCHSRVITRTKGRPGTTLAAVTTEFGLAWGHKRGAASTLGGRSAVTDEDCIVCHLEGNSTTKKVSTFHQDGNIDLRDPKGLTREAPITNISGAAFTFQRFSTSYAAGSRTTTGHTANTIDNVITQKFCLGCHGTGGATNPGSLTTGGTAAMPFGGIALGAAYSAANDALGTQGTIDVKKQVATTNSSKHPILGPRSAGYPTTALMAVPYNNFTRTAGTLANSVVLNCFDCHNQPPTVGAPITLRTIVAHGNANTVRGNATTSGTPNATTGTTLCTQCHAGYGNGTVQNHPTGSSFTSAGRSPMGTFLSYGCNICHSSGYDTAVPRPTRAQNVHGYPSTVSSGTTNTTYKVAFIRGNPGYITAHAPGKIGATTYGGSCTGMSGTTATSCNSARTETYTPGGVY